MLKCCTLFKIGVRDVPSNSHTHAPKTNGIMVPNLIDGKKVKIGKNK